MTLLQTQAGRGLEDELELRDPRLVVSVDIGAGGRVIGPKPAGRAESAQDPERQDGVGQIDLIVAVESPLRGGIMKAPGSSTCCHNRPACRE